MGEMIKVRVRPNNTYRISASESYGAGEEFEIDAAELKLVPHCLVSVEKDDAEKLVKAEEELAKAQANASIFAAAREAAFAASAAQREGVALARERSDEARKVSTDRLQAEIDRSRTAPPAKVARPKHDKKPDLA